MNYESFKQYVADHIRDFLPQDYNVHEINIMEQRKNNNVIWDALSIKGDRNIVPAIYLEPYYQAHTEVWNRWVTFRLLNFSMRR